MKLLDAIDIFGSLPIVRDKDRFLEGSEGAVIYINQCDGTIRREYDNSLYTPDLGDLKADDWNLASPKITFVEAMDIAGRGHTVRRKAWPEGQFAGVKQDSRRHIIVFRPDFRWDQSMSLDDVLAEDWELYT